MPNNAPNCSKNNRDQIDGILVVLPNFGDEKGVADTIKFSGLQVPILVQAYPDELAALNVANRRDAFAARFRSATICAIWLRLQPDQ